MTQDEAQAEARKLFGPYAYAIVIEKVGSVVIKHPKRIGLEIPGDKVRLPLGCGLKWREALDMAKASELGMEIRYKDAHAKQSEPKTGPEPHSKPTERREAGFRAKSGVSGLLSEDMICNCGKPLNGSHDHATCGPPVRKEPCPRCGSQGDCPHCPKCRRHLGKRDHKPSCPRHPDNQPKKSLKRVPLPPED